MTLEQFENMTIKEIAEACKLFLPCDNCPFCIRDENTIYSCLFEHYPQQWKEVFEEMKK